MFDALNIALSGMNAAQAQLNVTANNIANANTPGFQPQRQDLVELSGGGVRLGPVVATGDHPEPNGDGTSSSGTDLATESVNLIRESALYRANAAVVKTADQMYGTLLNILDTDHHRDRDA